MPRLLALCLLALATGCAPRAEPARGAEPAPEAEPSPTALQQARASWRARALDDAAQHAERALASAPDSADAAEILGRARLAQRRFDEAVRALGRARSLAPERARLHFPLATALEAAGDAPAATASYRASVEADRWPVRARIAIARIGVDALVANPEPEVIGELEPAIREDLDAAQRAAGDDEAARVAIRREHARIRALYADCCESDACPCSYLGGELIGLGN